MSFSAIGRLRLPASYSRTLTTPDAPPTSLSSRIQRVPRVGSTDCSRPSRKSGRWADDAALVNASENVVGRGIELAGVVAPDGEVLCDTAYTFPLVGPTRKRFPSDGVLA